MVPECVPIESPNKNNIRHTLYKNTQPQQKKRGVIVTKARPFKYREPPTKPEDGHDKVDEVREESNKTAKDHLADGKLTHLESPTEDNEVKAKVS